MTEEVFTMADAEDDGKIKREAGKTMVSVAKRESPRLFDHFENVCEEMGRSPANVLGGMAIMALEDVEYAKRLSRQGIDMSILDRDQIRMEDVEYVMELSEKLNLDEDGGDPIDEAIEKRIKSVTSSPLDKFRTESSGGGSVDKELAQTLERMNQKIEQLESEVTAEMEAQQQQAPDQSVDDLMGAVSDEEQQQDVAVEHEEVPETPEEEPQGQEVNVNVQEDDGGDEESMEVDVDGLDIQDDGSDGDDEPIISSEQGDDEE